ncbi:unnamed protein product, partial [Adineta steineri]
NALTCKSCSINDPFCSLPRDDDIRQCENDNDICYSWFHRVGGKITVERDCMPIMSPEYDLMKKMINYDDHGCVKRMGTFDCFTFCSHDLCN